MNFNTLYYRHPYRKAFDAVVTSCEKSSRGWLVTLDQTLFYPEGGGAPADTGLLNGAEILDVQLDPDDESQILHLSKKPFAPGEAVHGEINWPERFRRMQEHTGEHIVSGLAHRRFGCENVGFHMGDVITLDLDKPLSEDDLAGIELSANEIVWKNLPVSAVLPDSAALDSLDYRSKKELTGQVRLINIPDADSCACCGLHVRSTGEIGMIKLLSFMHYKHGTRITMTAGRGALLDFRKKHRALTESGRLLSVKPEEVPDAVRRVQKECREKDEKIQAANTEYFSALAALHAGETFVLLFEDRLNQIERRLLCNKLLENRTTKTAAVCSALPDSDACQYVIGSTGKDLRAAIPEINRRLSGHGGGRSDMVQGTFHADQDLIRTVCESFLDQ